MNVSFYHNYQFNQYAFESDSSLADLHMHPSTQNDWIDILLKNKNNLPIYSKASTNFSKLVSHVPNF